MPHPIESAISEASLDRSSPIVIADAMYAREMMEMKSQVFERRCTIFTLKAAATPPIATEKGALTAEEGRLAGHEEGEHQRQHHPESPVPQHRNDERREGHGDELLGQLEPRDGRAGRRNDQDQPGEEHQRAPVGIEAAPEEEEQRSEDAQHEHVVHRRADRAARRAFLADLVLPASRQLGLVGAQPFLLLLTDLFVRADDPFSLQDGSLHRVDRGARSLARAFRLDVVEFQVRLEEADQDESLELGELRATAREPFGRQAVEAVGREQRIARHQPLGAGRAPHAHRGDALAQRRRRHALRVEVTHRLFDGALQGRTRGRVDQDVERAGGRGEPVAVHEGPHHAATLLSLRGPYDRVQGHEERAHPRDHAVSRGRRLRVDGRHAARRLHLLTQQLVRRFRDLEAELRDHVVRRDHAALQDRRIGQPRSREEEEDGDGGREEEKNPGAVMHQVIEPVLLRHLVQRERRAAPHRAGGPRSSFHHRRSSPSRSSSAASYARMISFTSR
jgi:hypothetical protein